MPLTTMEEPREPSNSSASPGEDVDTSDKFIDLPEGGCLDLTEDETIGLLYLSASAEGLSSQDVQGEAREDTHESSHRGVLEERCSETETETETTSSRASTSYYDVSGFPNIPRQWKGFIQRWKLTSSVKRFSTFPHITVPKLARRRRRASQPDIVDDPELCFFKPTWKIFTLSEIEAATDNFSEGNLIGKGGYAEVFKGCLEDGQLVAIKRLSGGTSEEQTGDFLSELGIIVHINHPNTAKLIGFGVEGGMYLVLQLSPNGSLASILHDSKEKLDWSVRYKIAIGTAEGLKYLHEKCQRCIIHRDIKASNILLSQDFEAQICDFGLAKWLPDKLSHHTVSGFEGTFGYLAPEYLSHGIVDEKTDVFSFGVVLLELVTGRKALDSSQQSLVMWARPILEKNNFKELVDPSLGDAYDHTQLNCAVQTASLCTQHSSILRPPMSEVLKLLKGEEECYKATQKSHRAHSEELFDTEEYNATRYLKNHESKKHSFDI